MKRHVFTGSAVVALMLSGLAVAGTIYVDDDNTGGPWDGSQAYPYQYIQDGIDAAASGVGDVVMVLQGTYTGVGNKDLVFDGKTFTLQSQSGPDVTIIDCGGSGRGVDFVSGETSGSVLDGFTICNWNAGNGGGIRCIGSSPAIANCRITDNEATNDGGGVYCDSANPTLTDCVIKGNQAGNNGGALYCVSCHAGYYGSACEISDNSAANHGGGVYCESSSLTFSRCLIAGNDAGGDGGALYCVACLPGYYGAQCDNCTIVRNSAAGDGGAMSCFESDATLDNCTIAYNTAGGSGGCVTCAGSSMGSSPAFTNCIMWGDSPNELDVQLGTPVVTYCDVQGGWSGMGNIDADPGFAVDYARLMITAQKGDLDYRDFRVGPGSPCIDAGTSTGMPPTDMDGRPRYDDPTMANTGGGPESFFDIGVHEFKGYYVNGDSYIGSDSYDGLEPVYNSMTGHGPKLSIQEGLNAAADSDTVVVAPYTYTGPKNRALSFAGKAVMLVSESGPAGTTIDCQSTSWGFRFQSSEGRGSVVDGFTVTNGYATNGGGIRCVGSSPTLLNCAIEENTATSNGGGVHCDADSSPAFLKCVIDHNHTSGNGGGLYCINCEPGYYGCACEISDNSAANHGGGVYCESSSLTFSRCLIAGNDASGDGGAVYCTHCPSGYYCSTYEQCSIRNNSTGGDGGGMYFDLSSVTLTGCSIAGNEASGHGGAVYCTDCLPGYYYTQYANCTIARNSAGYDGGAIYCYESDARLDNCTIAHNTAGGSGGCVTCAGSSMGSSPAFTNCIMWGDSPNELDVQLGTPVVTYCDVQGGWSGMGNIDADPGFVVDYAKLMITAQKGDLNLDYRLGPGSPCIDAGTSTGTPSTDMDGRPRYDDPTTPNTGTGPGGDYYDMGAHEFKGYYVNGDPTKGSDAYDGLAPSYDGAHGPKLTIQAGLNDADGGDTVSVAPWTYTGAGNKDLDFAGKAIMLLSEAGAAGTVINCEATPGDRHRGFYFHSGETAEAVVDGVTIENGYVVAESTDGGGGGILCLSHSSPTITNCTIRASWAYPGDGGGIACVDYSSPMIVNCTIEENTAWYEGTGIYCGDHSSPTISNCTIEDNAGSLYCGGGIACEYSSSPTIANCTISGNSECGILCWESDPTITNCILWGNSPDEIHVTSGSPVVTYCDVHNGTGEPWFGTGCIDQDPLFVTGPLHGYYLGQTASGQATDSPCVDAGSDTAANLGLDTLTTRTDGVADSGDVDMGYHSPPAILGDVDGNGVVNGLDLTAVLSAWETTPGDPFWDPDADLDGNAIINGLDLTEVISFWTTAAAATPPAAPAPTETDVPKPGKHRSRPGNVKTGKGNVGHE